jgi:hypothetical protein
MRIGSFKLENTFLTAGNRVAMQWLDERGRNITLWMDKRGQIRNTSTMPVPAAVFDQALAHYMNTWKEVINHKYIK